MRNGRFVAGPPGIGLAATGGRTVVDVNVGKLGDAAVEAAGDIAGTAVDPRAGLGKLRSAVTPRAVAMVTAALLLGYLVARSRRRS